ncbi:heavy-metal-associated domain-containing protein [Collinsella sp. AGMB00827]|uniref:Heavy-metal-associated domain-containing protein n=1 Tax=Collinsella ureilytica TaxID=2869515 RepID=A0ABS7MLM7_9ACTN|nr:heavy metal-associated domain-containing protein [Collinsella urealyticum]MBY4798270.1 heavy-metal-associated domain-containing protein [Collinsella urealyticum]
MNYIIKTEGLNCGHCDASVESALMQVAGVIDADADHATATVQVMANKPIEHEALASAIASAGAFRALSITEA